MDSFFIGASLSSWTLPQKMRSDFDSRVNTAREKESVVLANTGLFSGGSSVPRGVESYRISYWPQRVFVIDVIIISSSLYIYESMSYQNRVLSRPFYFMTTVFYTKSVCAFFLKIYLAGATLAVHVSNSPKNARSWEGLSIPIKYGVIGILQKKLSNLEMQNCWIVLSNVTENDHRSDFVRKR